MEPGKQAFRRFIARPGTVAAKVLEAVAEDNSTRCPRSFDEWQNEKNGKISKGAVQATGADDELRPVILVIGDAKPDVESIVLQVERGKRIKLRDTIIILGSDISDTRIRSLANMIMATYVVHGRGWRDSLGKVHTSPCGSTVDLVRRRKRNEKRRKRHRENAKSCRQGSGMFGC